MTERSKTSSRTAEEYLRAIYGMSCSGTTVTTTSLARELGVSPSTASGMVSKLRTRGLVEHPPYGPISTTQAGADSVRSVLQRRRLIEEYLVHRLGCRGDYVYTDAIALEHAASTTLIDRIAEHTPRALQPDRITSLAEMAEQR